MKREGWICKVWAVTFAFCSAIAGLGIMVTGLELPANLVRMALLCLLAAVALCALLNCQHGGWIAGSLSLAVWLSPELRLGLKAIARQIAHYISMAYDSPIPTWLEDEAPKSLEPVLLVLGCLMMTLWIRCILKRRATVSVIGASLIPLITCITVTDTVPQVHWVFLWALPLVLLLMTQHVRRASVRQGNRLTALLLVPTTLAMALLFWMIPEEKANGWEISGTLDRLAAQLPFTQETPDGGIQLDLPTASLKDQVTLNTLGERILSDREIMEVSADRSGTLYLRERDYDYYNGIAWTSTSGRQESLTVLPDSITTGEGEVRLQVQYRKDYYYLPCYAGETVSLQDGMMKNLLRSRSYSFPTRKLHTNWRQRILSPSTAYYDETYLQLPEDTRLRALVYLQNTALENYWSDEERAEFISDLVENCAQYDLNPDRMPLDQNDLAMWFLEDGARGYCVHFATAATVLLRAAGIHARYVEGYMIETQPGQTVAVEQRHGHAWVEYYIQGAGWIILDATPAEALQSTETTPEESSGNTTPSTTEPITTTQPTESQVTGPESPSTPIKEEHWNWMPLVLIPSLLAAAGMAIGGQYTLRRKRKQKRMMTGHPNSQGLARYRELVHLAACMDVPVSPPITDLAQKAKFSRHTLTKQELNLLTEQITELRLNLQELPLRKRLIAKFIWVLY